MRNIKKIDIFISGVFVDFCIPIAQFTYKSSWYSWYNDQKYTLYLAQVIYSKPCKLQQNHFENLNDSRFLLIIHNKQSLPISVISLCVINSYSKLTYNCIFIKNSA